MVHVKKLLSCFQVFFKVRFIYSSRSWYYCSQLSSVRGWYHNPPPLHTHTQTHTFVIPRLKALFTHTHTLSLSCLHVNRQMNRRVYQKLCCPTPLLIKLHLIRGSGGHFNKRWMAVFFTALPLRYRHINWFSPRVHAAPHRKLRVVFQTDAEFKTLSFSLLVILKTGSVCFSAKSIKRRSPAVRSRRHRPSFWPFIVCSAASDHIALASYEYAMRINNNQIRYRYHVWHFTGEK